MNTKWVEIFLRAGISEHQMLDPKYLFSQFTHGVSCKACGGPIVLGSNLEAHIEVHRKELAQYKSKRAKEIQEAREAHLEEARKEIGKNAFSKEPRTTPQFKKGSKVYGEYYSTPCEDCGQGIKRTGKRGRPPTKCERCRR